jgi:hypothetical protein
VSLEVSLSRSGEWSVAAGAVLALSDLTIGDHPDDGTFWVPEDGVTWPSFAITRGYSPESDAIGSELLKAVPGKGQTSLTIYAHATTLALLLDAMDELEAATSQFHYDLTFTLDGTVSRTWRADSELPQWGSLEAGKVKAKMTTATITIPLNPIGSA